MSNDKYMVMKSEDVRKKYKQLKESSSIISKIENENSDLLQNFEEFISDVFCSFYMEKAEIKEIEHISANHWVNYYLVESLIGHYQFSTLQSFTNGLKKDALWITELFVQEMIKYINSKKKVAESLKKSLSFISEVEDEGINYIKIISPVSINATKEEKVKNKVLKKNMMTLKQDLKAIISKTMTEVNAVMKKLNPLIQLTRGNNLCPLSLLQVPYDQRIALSEKIVKPKEKEILKVYTQSNISSNLKQKDQKGKSWDESSGSFNQEIFYLNEPDTKIEKYKDWLIKELENYNANTIYGPITVHIIAGHNESNAKQIENLAVVLEIIEVARLQKRKFMAIISGLESSDKTYIISSEEIEIYESNNNNKLSPIEGMVEFLKDLLSGPKPPKPEKQKMSLNLNMGSGSKAEPKRKKIFKKRPTVIKF